MAKVVQYLCPPMKKPKRFTVTAALPYANGPLHIGHVAGCYLPADTYVRYLRSLGHDVFFVCGSDEHGVPITIKAQKQGVSPQAVVDQFHFQMKKAFTDFDIQFDFYGRTSSTDHHKFTADFFLTLYNNNQFIEEETDQYYDEHAKKFLADRYIIGTCPHCQNPDAYGDQCEKCGRSLDPSDLINPKSALTQTIPIKKKTKNWDLPLDRLQKTFLDDYIKSHQADWKPNVFGQCRSWLQEGLRPRAMTRDLDWGVKVPIEGVEGKVLYVWFDAPLGYISNTMTFFKSIGKPDEWLKYWKKDEQVDQQLIHFIGKDNIVFHCLIFPAMLHAWNKASSSQTPFLIPTQVPANEFLNLEGKKLSTSRNWAVWLHEYLEDFPGRTDELRYYLTSIAPDTKDSDFTWIGFQLAVNSELVSILGNYINRVWVLFHKYYQGIVPETTAPMSPDLMIHENEVGNFHQFMENYRFREALQWLMERFRQGNKYLAETQPWHLIKSNPEAAASVLVKNLRYLHQLLPFIKALLPRTHQKIWAMMGLYEGEEIQVGHVLCPPDLLFQPISEEEIQKAQGRLFSNDERKITDTTTAQPQVKPMINYDDFVKLDLRLVTIISAIQVEGTDKLIKLEINTGTKVEIVVSGVAHQMKPEDLIGKQVLWLENLEPRKIRGILSKGMILMASDEQDNLSLLLPEQKMPNGAIVK